MMARLSGKTAIVTGAASGIGRATAMLFAAEGAQVLIVDVNGAGAAETLKSVGSGASAHKVDVTSEPAWQKLMAMCLDQHGRLDVLVNCAGIGRAGNFEELSLDDWDMQIAVNLTGVFLGCKHGVKAMRAAGNGGSIINISSIAGLVGGDDIAGYSASKGGVTTLTKSIALHCAKYRTGIRCNSIHPTYVDSEMLDPVAETFPSREAMLAGMAEAVPMGRVATPLDIAKACLFLASDESSMISGSPLLVDGAQLAGMASKHTT